MTRDASVIRNILALAAVNAPVPTARKLGIETEDRPVAWLKNNYGWSALGGVTAARAFSATSTSSRGTLDSGTSQIVTASTPSKKLKTWARSIVS
jgi:hypothetical protein